MKKIIKLTESDLREIVSKVLEEQSVIGSPNYGMVSGKSNPSFNSFYKCLPENVRLFANYVKSRKKELMSKLQVDEKTLLIMAKAAMGIIGRETSFGEGTDFKDEAIEFLISIGLESIPQGAQTAYNSVRKLAGKGPQQMSLGPAQFTQDTWNQYGLDKKIGPYNESFNTINQGLGALHRINDDYKLALKTGTGTGPSVNPIAVRQGKITSIKGTGNNALDLAIVSHNMSGLINKWCKTSNPNYAGPCSQKVYQPFKDTKPELKINVYQNKQILNYFPNKGSAGLTSIGYLEEVANYINKFNCYSI